jgi:hypothetical protein
MRAELAHQKIIVKKLLSNYLKDSITEKNIMLVS